MISPKKIIFVPLLNHTPWGGSEILWTGLASHLLAQGHEVSVLIKFWNALPQQIVSLQSKGAQMKFHSQRSVKNKFVHLARRLIGHPELYPEEEWIVSQRPALLVTSGDGMAGLPIIELAAKHGLRYAYIMQANSESWWPSDDLVVRMRQALESSKGSILFVSERNRDLFELQIGMRLANAQIIRNPHGAIGFAPLPWPKDGSVNSVVKGGDPIIRFAFVGRLEPIAKGQDLFLQALADPIWRDRSWSLSFYGDGFSEFGVQEMTKLLGLQERVSFHGKYRTLLDVWRDHHVLLMASRYEGLPLALCEAMALGRPAVVTDVGDCAILLRDGIEGFVASAASKESIAKALEAAWLRKDNLEGMGRAASSRVHAFLPENPIATAASELLRIAQE